MLKEITRCTVENCQPSLTFIKLSAKNVPSFVNTTMTGRRINLPLGGSGRLKKEKSDSEQLDTVDTVVDCCVVDLNRPGFHTDLVIN